MDQGAFLDLLGFSTGELERLGLIIARISGLFLGAPFFSRAVGPARIKTMLIMALAIVIFPLVPPWTGEDSGDALLTASAALSELIIGTIIGFIVHWALITVQLAGNVVGFEIGLSMAQVMDPTSGMQEGVISNLMYLGALMIFLTIDGHHLLVEGMVRTFRSWPLGSGLPPADQLLEGMVTGVTRLFATGLLIAAPVIVASKLLYLGMGLINRASPQIQVFFVAMPLTQMVGMAVLGITMVTYGEIVTRELEAFIHMGLRIFGL